MLSSEGWFVDLPSELARGYRKGYWKPRRMSRIVANIWHTTGAGPVRRHKRDPKKFPTSFDAAMHVYVKLMKAGPHFVIGQQGQLSQVAPLNCTAWHVGKSKSWGYFNAKTVPGKKYAWWRKRWEPWGIKSPIQLADGELWKGHQCNPNTVGIEIAPPEDNPWGPWSDQCWEAITDLSTLLERYMGIPIDPMHQLGHADAHPKSRTNGRGVGWDPHPDAWDPWMHCLRVKGS